LESPLDLDQVDAAKFMERVQGNILKGHSRHRTAQVFVRFGPDVAATRAWIAGNVRPRVTSALQQVEQISAWRATRAGEPFLAFFLSYQGYVRLGIADAATPNDIYFRAGMKIVPVAAEERFEDPPVSEWEENFRGRIDAMILVAADDVDRLNRILAVLTKDLRAVAEHIFVEQGDQLTCDFGGGRTKVPIEHFGHQDGISQPRMIKQRAEKEMRERGGSNWDPTAPLSLCFVAEPSRTDEFGSYLVFRKLGQNVKAFRAACDRLAATLGIAPEDAAALAVGRYRDGRPVVPARVVVPGADPNDFNFDSDPHAGRCPYQSHIRKMNPRGDVARFVPGKTDGIEREFRIVRRGITFGKRPDLASGSTLPPPETGVGLLFMCYQARLIQFVIQQNGADINDFVKAGVGPDAVIGRNPAAVPQRWPLNGAPSDTTFAMSNFTTMLGGEYFFAPSLSFLASL
jgi:Dyp-type peroxidase family